MAMVLSGREASRRKGRGTSGHTERERERERERESGEQEEAVVGGDGGMEAQACDRDLHAGREAEREAHKRAAQQLQPDCTAKVVSLNP
jgi:hypothetical protein